MKNQTNPEQTDIQEQYNLVEYSNLSADLQKIYVKQDLYIRLFLAKNPNLIQEVQEILAKDPHQYVRMNLAQNPSLLPEIQDILCQDEHLYVRSFLAGNKNLTLKVKEILKKDSSDYVLFCLEKSHGGTGKIILLSLALMVILFELISIVLKGD